MAGIAGRIVRRLGWIGMSCLIALLYFVLGTVISLLGGDFDVALGSLVITLLLLAVILWVSRR